MTPEQILQLEVENVIRLADALNMRVEIVNKPLEPLAMGHTTPVVTIWQTRRSRNVLEAVASDPVGFKPSANEHKWVKDLLQVMYETSIHDRDTPKLAEQPMSDREWAALCGW
jgi:hypothetical protein